jgi:hypothetical protein
MFNFILGLVIGACAVSLIFIIAILIGEAKRKPKKCKKCGKLKTKCECPPTEKQLKSEAKRLEKELKVARLKDAIDNLKK